MVLEGLDGGPPHPPPWARGRGSARAPPCLPACRRTAARTSAARRLPTRPYTHVPRGRWWRRRLSTHVHVHYDTCGWRPVASAAAHLLPANAAHVPCCTRSGARRHMHAAATCGPLSTGRVLTCAWRARPHGLRCAATPPCAHPARRGGPNYPLRLFGRELVHNCMSEQAAQLIPRRSFDDTLGRLIRVSTDGLFRFAHPGESVALLTQMGICLRPRRCVCGWQSVVSSRV